MNIVYINTIDIYYKESTSEKMIHVARDFNLNVLDYTTNIKVKSFACTTFEHRLIPKTNKCTRVTKI